MLKLTKGSGTAWNRNGRGRGRGRGGAVFGGSVVGPGNYPPGFQNVSPEFREVVNILGERNRLGRLTGVGQPTPTSEDEKTDDEEEGNIPKRPPRPLYRRVINYVRQAWTGVKFALGN